MIRFTFQVAAVILTTAATMSYAADTMFGLNPNPAGSSAVSGARFKSRLSPEEYSNAVSQVEAQTNDNLSQQVKNLFPKSAGPATATTPDMTNQPPLPNQQPEITISNPPSVQPGGTQQTTTTTTKPANTYSRPTVTQQPPPPQQVDTYTGFGSGSKGSSSPSKSGSSTGLGIKY